MADHDETKKDEKKEPEKIPDESWTETQIEDWIEAKGLPIDYDIRRRTKKWALNQIQLNIKEVK